MLSGNSSTILPGDPLYTVKDGTTAAGGITVLSSIFEHSLMMANFPWGGGELQGVHRIRQKRLIN